MNDSSDSIKVVAGLGNPGSKYSSTRHNAGFMLLDLFVNDEWSEKKELAFIKKGDVFFVKPLSFMNLSGEPLREFTRFYKIKAEEVLVVHDEIDISLGEIRLKKGGGTAGHNGLKSIVENLGTKEFYRMRLGVGKPQEKRMDVSDWVLQKFASDEEDKLSEMLYEGKEMLTYFLKEGLKETQKRFR